jgi:hypothetical protein
MADAKMLVKPTLLSGPTGPYEHGYLMCRVKYSDGRIKMVGYHKYIYELEHGRVIEGMMVHHKDENKSNNDISNLELKFRSEHASLHMIGREAKIGTYECTCCKKIFKRNIRQVRHNQEIQLKKGPYCSRKCNGLENN